MSNLIKVPDWLDVHQNDDEFVCIDEKIMQLFIRTKVLVKCEWRIDNRIYLPVYLPVDFKSKRPDQKVVGVILWEGKYKIISYYVNQYTENTFYFVTEPFQYVSTFEKYLSQAENIQRSLDNTHKLDLDV